MPVLRGSADTDGRDILLYYTAHIMSEVANVTNEGMANVVVSYKNVRKFQIIAYSQLPAIIVNVMRGVMQVMLIVIIVHNMNPTYRTR